MKNIHEQFLSYLEGELNTEERNSFEQELNQNADLKKDYEEFSLTYNALNIMGSENAKAPQGFEDDVMKAISLVNKRSSIMTTFFKILGKGLLSIICSIFILTSLIYFLSLEKGRFILEKSFFLVEGRFGAILMLFAAILAIASIKLPKNFKSKVLIPIAPTFAGIATLLFVSRSLTSLFFGETTYNDVLPPAPSEKVAMKKTNNPSTITYNDEFVRSPLSGLQAKVDKAISNITSGSNSDRKKYESESFSFPESKNQGAAILEQNEIKDAALVAPTIQKPRTDGRVEAFSNNEIYADYITTEVNTEEYSSSVENNYIEAKKEALTTFSIDVDTASYSNVRRFLTQNQLPPKDSIRTEEMINYFKYDYPLPSSKEVPFSVTTELVKAPWEEKHQLLHVGLKGYEESANNLPASNLVFLIDVSGSMDSPEKLPLLKQGMRLLVEQLRSQDRIAIVTYAGNAGLALDSKSGDQKQEILAAINNMQPGGSTAGAAGIELAYNVAKSHLIKDGNNRIILATDGDFNVGISSDTELVKLIEEKRKTGIFLSVLGFGMGNYKDSKMEQLADKGNGNYAYIDNIHEAKKVLVNDFRSTVFAIAKDVKIQIEFNPAYVQAYRLIGYENRMLNKEDFNDDTKDAGELGAGHSVTAIYEIVPVGAEFRPTVDNLKYQPVTPTPVAAEYIKNGELATVKLRYKLPNEDTSKLISQVVNSSPNAEMSNNLKFASSVAEFGMILRESNYKGSSTFDSALKLANESKGEDSLGYRAEFIKLIETAKLLQK